jgi:hypothetical protein
MAVVENKNEGLLIRAEPLRWAHEVCHRMADVMRIADGALFLAADPQWVGAINAVLVEKGVLVKEIRKQSIPEWPVASGRVLST